MKKNKILMIIIIIIVFISSLSSKGELVENLEIPYGVGADIEKNGASYLYKIPTLIYSFQTNGDIVGRVIVGVGKSIGETRENRQLISSKKFLMGLNRVFIFSEEASRDGIRNYIDINTNNPDINDRSLCVVCKGKPEDMLKHKVIGYTSSAEYIEGMVKNLKQFNFFPMEYKTMDIIVRIDSEGRNVILPYLELKEEGIKTTGIAIFKGDKMVAKADMEEAKIINLLKQNNVRGILTIKQPENKQISFYGNSKRKIRMFKENGKYKINIALNITGQLLSNELYKNLVNSPEKLKQFEEDMSRKVENMCNGSIEKIYKQYGVDVLDLGRIAASQYGRHTGVDWNRVMMDSEIQVTAKVKVDTEGRGFYE